MHECSILAGKHFLLLLHLSHGKEARGEALQTYQSSSFSFKHSLIVRSRVAVLWCKQKPFRGTTVIRFLGERSGGCVFLHTQAGHNWEFVFRSAGTCRKERPRWRVSKFKRVFLLVKNCDINANVSPCCDLKPFPFKRNRRPQKWKVTAIPDSLYFISQLDKKGGDQIF